MTDEQRSLAGYKGNVHEGGEFENPNEGKPKLDDSEEYVFRLTSFPKVKSFSQDKEKKNPDGTTKKETIKVDKAICEFEEEKTKNVVLAFFRVDSLNFTEEESYESGVVRFFKKIKCPLPENAYPDWTQHFLVGMRFRGRVVVKNKKDKDGNVVTNYYLDVPTCRPILESDKHKDAEPAATPSQTSATLANALFNCKGAKSYSEAEDMLKKASAPVELLTALFQANLEGKLTFPI